MQSVLVTTLFLSYDVIYNYLFSHRFLTLHGHISCLISYCISLLSVVCALCMSCCTLA